MQPGHRNRLHRRYDSLLPERERIKAAGKDLYGFPFTRRVRMDIESAIRRNDSQPEARLNANRSIHVVSLSGVGKVRVVYSVERHEVVDVLPLVES